MERHTFNYYGFDKETYTECLPLIKQSNRKSLLTLTSWFLVVDIIYLSFSCLNVFGTSREHLLLYGIFAVAATLLEASLIFAPALCDKYSVLFVYISIAGSSIYGISISITHSYLPGSSFLVFLTLTAVTYVDKMIRMVSSLFLLVALFITTSFYFKTFSIAYYDTYHVVVILFLAIGLHYMFQRIKMQQFVLFIKNAQIQHELEIKSSFDSLTSLLNRWRFFSYSEEILSNHANQRKFLGVIDLDGFKQINDNLGHQAGDKVIQITAKIIKDTLNIPNEDTFIKNWNPSADIPLAGRLGGDEFIIILTGRSTLEETHAKLNTLLHNLNAVRLNGVNGIQASIGISEILPDEMDIDAAYKRADEALYASKRAGKNRLCYADDSKK
ncbi:MAG: GGDEF domain-containing protein [Treponema sp.]|nr:GGDEF domain-containing protein [Treponema sp.]